MNSSCFIYNDDSAAYGGSNGFATALTPSISASSGGGDEAAGGTSDGPTYALAPSLLGSSGPGGPYAAAAGAYANSCWAAAAANHPAAKYRKFAATFAWPPPPPPPPHMAHQDGSSQMVHAGLDMGSFSAAFTTASCAPSMCGVEPGGGQPECGQLAGRAGATPTSGGGAAGQPVWPWMTVVGELSADTFLIIRPKQVSKTLRVQGFALC